MIQILLARVVEISDEIKEHARQLERDWRGTDERTTNSLQRLIKLSNEIKRLIEGGQPCNVCKNQPPDECNNGGHCILPNGHDGEHSYA